MDFFSNIKHAFGQSALLLSGGAYFGIYHGGVLKALREKDLIPKIVTGSSAGSINAGIFASYNNEDMEYLFDNLDF